MITEKIITNFLEEAGIRVNGDNPWDIRVYNKKLYRDVMMRGSLALGEGYMNKWWDVEDLSDCVYRIWSSDITEKSWLGKLGTFSFLVKGLFSNAGSERRSKEIGEKHYDIGNDLYAKMLGDYAIYSCGYWPNAKNLNDAQLAKLDLICRKLQIERGMTVLDIGCGFGEAAKFIAERYGAHVVGVTVSKEQKKMAEEKCKGLPVTIELMDYRKIGEKYSPFDRILSVGMFEHVGWKNYSGFMKTVNSLLKENGVFLLHTIGISADQLINDPWIEKYIFPGAILPSKKRIQKSINGLFTDLDWHNFGPDYDRTLVAWFENFEKSWPILRAKYGDRFYRMWKFYLLSCAGSFRAKNTHLWQIVLVKKGNSMEYKPVR